MPRDEKEASRSIHVLSILYLVVLAIAFYSLYLSRRDEVLTVWGVIHIAFIPSFIIATFILLTIIFSAERTEFKLLFTILHSILSHSLMVIIFPAGNIGVQQTILGQTRLVFDNVISHGLGSSRESLPLILYISLRGENLQTAFSVIFARMLSVDVYWTHLLLVPFLWGIFVPSIAFMISKTLGANERIAALAALITSLFPTTIIWGYVSIPNGLGYLFFFCFLFFLLQYVKKNGTRNLLLAASFLLVSFMSHFLAGSISLSLLLLAYSVKTFEKEKRNSPRNAKFVLLISFVLCTSILPFALVYRRLFYPTANTRFSLQILYESPSTDVVFSFLLGRYSDLISREAYITTLIFGVPVLVGFVTLMFILRANQKKPSSESAYRLALFFALSFFMIALNDRIIKLFMIDVPFTEVDRLWIIRDLLLTSFVSLFIGAALWEIRAFFDKIAKGVFIVWRKRSSADRFSETLSFLGRGHLAKGVSVGSVLSYALVFLIVSSWVSASIFYAYPHWAPLQTTSYELEAVKEIHETTKEKYIVITDQWLIFAGQMFAGIKNPQAFYFSPYDPRGISLFLQMRNNPTNEILIDSMEYNNATIAYFMIAKSRLGTEVYNNTVQKAQENGLQTYKIFYYKADERIHVFYYKKI